VIAHTIVGTEAGMPRLMPPMVGGQTLVNGASQEGKMAALCGLAIQHCNCLFALGQTNNS
jgi:hypothetical protein